MATLTCLGQKMSDNKPLLISLAVVGIIILGYLGYTFTGESDKDVVTTSLEIPKSEPVVLAEPEPVIEPEPEVVLQNTPAVIKTPEQSFILPLLDDSDQLIRDGAVSLTRHEGVNAWLSPNELVRKIVTFTDSVANGNIAREPLGVLMPKGKFLVKQINDKVLEIEPKSYERYDVVTNILVSIDTKRAVEFYILLRPLFQQAYDELGYPEGKFEDVIFKSIGRLLETPAIDEPIRVIQPVVMFEYEDVRLEMLSPVQKQMIRMGPKNTRAIKRKLSEIAAELRSVLE